MICSAGARSSGTGLLCRRNGVDHSSRKDHRKAPGFFRGDCGRSLHARSGPQHSEVFWSRRIQEPNCEQDRTGDFPLKEAAPATKSQDIRTTLGVILGKVARLPSPEEPRHRYCRLGLPPALGAPSEKPSLVQAGSPQISACRLRSIGRGRQPAERLPIWDRTAAPHSRARVASGVPFPAFVPQATA